MNRLLIAIVVAGALFAADAPPKMSADEMKQAIESTERLVLLDVREPKELVELGTLKGYVNIPLGELEKRLEEVPKDRKVLVFCNRAARAAKAGELLQKNGYDNIIGLGAMNEWKEKNYEVVYPEKP